VLEQPDANGQYCGDGHGNCCGTATSGRATDDGDPGLANLPASLAGLPGLAQLAGIGQLLPSLIPAPSLTLANCCGHPVVAAGAVGAAALPGLDQVLTIIGLASAALTTQRRHGRRCFTPDSSATATTAATTTARQPPSPPRRRRRRKNRPI